MMNGRVEGVYIAHIKGGPMVALMQAHLLPGRGIEGDRYLSNPHQDNAARKTGIQVTLVEIEAVESMINDGIKISAVETRRNIVTRGVSLNNLVGRLFYIGNAQLRGIRLCEPCEYLAGRTDPRVLSSMSHRGGLRADIITEGIIHLNDVIAIAD